jgi:tetratricopeptide (TPR) repeat protein
MTILHPKVCLATVVVLLLAGLACPCLASEVHASQVDELLARGENRLAWELLQKFPDSGAGSKEKLWREARTRYEMGRLAESEEQALAFFQEAENYARAAIAAGPDQGDGYKWLAIALGAQSKFLDIETQVRQSREIKESIQKAITLAPDDDIAYLVLSRWHYKISSLGFLARAFANIVYGGLPEASLDEAEKLLLRAIELHDRIAHRYNLARVYEQKDDRDRAVRQYRQTLLLPVTFPEEAEEQVKAQKKLLKWQKR